MAGFLLVTDVLVNVLITWMSLRDVVLHICEWSCGLASLSLCLSRSPFSLRSDPLCSAHSSVPLLLPPIGRGGKCRCSWGEAGWGLRAGREPVRTRREHRVPPLSPAGAAFTGMLAEKMEGNLQSSLKFSTYTQLRGWDQIWGDVYGGLRHCWDHAFHHEDEDDDGNRNWTLGCKIAFTASLSYLNTEHSTQPQRKW